jgi:(R,R)-butanediol dehydrogenase/meso-butanediol dehydrogenase/diacetyl reductase
LHAALGGAPDIVFECAGFPGAWMQAMSWARPQGLIVGMGYGLQPEAITSVVPLRKELRRQFSMGSTHADYEQVIATLTAGHPEPRRMITGTVSLEGLTGAVQQLVARAPQCKILVDPWA